jgi:hypothetical protein
MDQTPVFERPICVTSLGFACCIISTLGSQTNRNAVSSVLAPPVLCVVDENLRWLTQRALKCRLVPIVLRIQAQSSQLHLDIHNLALVHWNCFELSAPWLVQYNLVKFLRDLMHLLHHVLSRSKSWISSYR